MKLFLHIGYNKAGTSSIQSFLNSRRAELLAQGVLYPETGIFDNAHYGITKSLLGNPANNQIVADAGTLSALSAEITDKRAENVIISSEYFILANKEQVQKTGDFVFNMLHADSANVIVYVRRHDTWFESLFNQAVKTMDSPPWEMDIRDYVLHILGGCNPETSYLKVLTRWSSVFGKANILVRPFERSQFAGGDLLSDFFSLTGADIAAMDKSGEESGARNESVRSDVLYLVGLLRRIPQKKDRNRLIANILGSEEISVPFAPAHFSKFSPPVRKSIVRFFESEYEVIAKEYLHREDGRLFHSSL